MGKTNADAAEHAVDQVRPGQNYIADMLAELRRLSDQQGLKMLAYLIGMAQIEAESLKNCPQHCNSQNIT